MGRQRMSLCQNSVQRILLICTFRVLAIVCALAHMLIRCADHCVIVVSSKVINPCQNWVPDCGPPRDPRTAKMRTTNVINPCQNWVPGADHLRTAPWSAWSPPLRGDQRTGTTQARCTRVHQNHREEDRMEFRILRSVEVIAALFVERGGPYWHLDGVDPWDEQRDARLYDGPHPVVAHPPCSRWCRLAGLVEARWGYRRGEDGGCFAAALEAVRRWGGVLEHPAYSDAWAAYGLTAPPTGGGWVAADFEGGWTCCVEQGRYGHPARKRTWLYAHSVRLPRIRWGYVADCRAHSLVSWCGNHVSFDEHRNRVGKKAASRTPDEFRDALIAMARSAEK